jgi:hypothetical protein
MAGDCHKAVEKAAEHQLQSHQHVVPAHLGFRAVRYSCKYNEQVACADKEKQDRNKSAPTVRNRHVHQTTSNAKAINLAA